MTHGVLLAVLALALAACDRGREGTELDVPAAASENAPDAALPSPTAPAGASVTGMPTRPPPRPAEPVAEAEPVDTATTEPAFDVASAPVDDASLDGTLPPPISANVPPPPAAAPNAPAPPPASELAAAGSVVTQYMTSLSAGAFATAQGLWLTTPNDSAVLQLARGAGFAVSVGPAGADPTGRVTVPVDVRGRADDGAARHLQVNYALQRSPSGGWRILSATVRDLAP